MTVILASFAVSVTVNIYLLVGWYRDIEKRVAANKSLMKRIEGLDTKQTGASFE